MVFQVASAGLSAALRSSVLSLAKTCSIGLSAGLKGGRKKSLAPAARIARRNGFSVVAAETVHDDDASGLQRRYEQL